MIHADGHDPARPAGMNPGVRTGIAAGLLLLLPLADAAAQVTTKYPVRPIRLVLPFPPGGSTDIVARLVGQKLAETWGQQVLVDNRPGGGGNVAAEFVARSPADGYTLFQVNVANAIGASLYPKLGYNLTTDFAAVTQLVTTPYVLLTHPSVPARSMRDLIALAKARPGQLNYASAGAGSATHLSGELLKSMAGVNIVHVPYKGTGPAVTALLSGEIELYFATVPAAAPMVKAGRLRALGVSSAKRASLMPDVPAIAEAGLAGYDTGTWHGILVPAATPREIVAQLGEEIVRILNTPDARERLVGQGLDPVGDRPDQFAAFLRAEIAKWAKVVAASGARAE
jgi:tripartite-type tricarboxylate transporter receptor subunit TctC